MASSAATTRRKPKRPGKRRWPTIEALLAARLRHASKGAGRAAVLRGWIASIGERVEPGPPALDHWARGRWEEERRAELHDQIDDIQEREEGRRSNAPLSDRGRSPAAHSAAASDIQGRAGRGPGGPPAGGIGNAVTDLPGRPVGR